LATVARSEKAPILASSGSIFPVDFLYEFKKYNPTIKIHGLCKP